MDDDAVTATTVHGLQVVDDAPTDAQCRPRRDARACRREDAGPKPSGADWSEIDAERRAEIPVLERLTRS
ncbi:hypothetical protein [Halorarius halobius]|uniref:hypothetical protein n=1 Tax=Halorarius halobius TaxID=2962671 RepID=UPI0020CBAAC9|nr:hypothetical protein [Halorarius halobius]